MTNISSLETKEKTKLMGKEKDSSYLDKKVNVIQPSTTILQRIKAFARSYRKGDVHKNKRTASMN